MFQRTGYLISMASVLLLGLVAWDGSDNDAMRVATVIGVLTSILGMGFRWVSFEREEKPRSSKAPDPAYRARREAPVPSPAHHGPGRSAHLT